ncbi:MAG: TlpA family protein disulfide reductase [Thiobacillus sp.]|uniref:TlpA family protein disulfide reductase n=1 Tax=Thiobacillus sp. 63-78 TaxID=1895859 RepID=UPI001AC2641A|nr:TlpA disulfide reductase family protein [Thiobacillus sp. 63-78]MBN8763067.1 TlpA family protein disulfide reductase [Thiobacillus sp.]MBN8765182.1 TlpA family protein disulfide reductase [Thiobacillus sp.]MBN8774070.1 TlpA family protein disulfide reductase [Thiobacillus sp.]
MIMLVRLCIFLAGLCAGAVSAAEPARFDAGSLAKIEARYAGKPFILSLWSVNWCGHCINELTMLGKLSKHEKNLPLVLVAVDSPEDSEAIRKTLHKLGLNHAESWVFDDPIPERLRATVDPAWQGELPRSYLYDKAHRRQAEVGELDETKLKAWLKQQRQ